MCSLLDERLRELCENQAKAMGTAVMAAVKLKSKMKAARAAREAARATPQLAAAPVPPVAGEQRPQAATCKALALRREWG